jgi:hypothetical protein
MNNKRKMKKKIKNKTFMKTSGGTVFACRSFSSPWIRSMCLLRKNRKFKTTPKTHLFVDVTKLTMLPSKVKELKN